MYQYTHPLKSIISNKDFLEQLATEFGTPLYVYDGERLKQNITRLNDALSRSFHHYKICYALKANTNPHLISLMKSAVPDMGADCSSPGELYIARKVGIPPNSCIYTGNYESPEELKFALESGVHLNLDDITSYHRLRKIGLPGEISFRLNPGFGKGTFPAIVTGGKEAKFGVPKEKILDAYQLAKNDGIQQFGMQCMPGSGNIDPDYFVQLLTAILEVARSIENKLSFQFNFISMGGGLGIPYKENERPLNISLLFEKLAEIFYTFYRDTNAPTLFIEPGKYIVGDTGFVLSRVTGKKASYKNFIGLDAGMNTLIRPAFYDAYHRIFKVGDPDAEPAQTVDFTGSICENTDRLARERPFPEVAEGDLVAIMDAGAYGYAMANQYNTRPRPAEVLLLDGKAKLIRQRETIEDIFKLCNC